MKTWEAVRSEILSYNYAIPTFQDLTEFLNKDPTLVNVKSEKLPPGAIILDNILKGVWVVMEIIKVDSDRTDIHWVFVTNYRIQHTQQVFHKDHYEWPVYLYTLSPLMDDICPFCNIKLTWISCAEKCTKCWYVKPYPK